MVSDGSITDIALAIGEGIVQPKYKWASEMDAGDKIWVIGSEGPIRQQQLSQHIAYRWGRGCRFMCICGLPTAKKACDAILNVDVDAGRPIGWS